jgi:hypothetical protein
VWSGRAAPPSLADLAAMLWAERVPALAVGGAICALGLAAALAAPQSRIAAGEPLAQPILIVTLVIAGVVSIAAGLSRGLGRRRLPTAWSAAPGPMRQPPVRAKPALTVIEGGADQPRGRTPFTAPACARRTRPTR